MSYVSNCKLDSSSIIFIDSKFNMFLVHDTTKEITYEKNYGEQSFFYYM